MRFHEARPRPQCKKQDRRLGEELQNRNDCWQNTRGQSGDRSHVSGLCYVMLASARTNLVQNKIHFANNVEQKTHRIILKDGLLLFFCSHLLLNRLSIFRIKTNLSSNHTT